MKYRSNKSYSHLQSCLDCSRDLLFFLSHFPWPKNDPKNGISVKSIIIAHKAFLDSARSLAPVCSESLFKHMSPPFPPGAPFPGTRKAFPFPAPGRGKFLFPTDFNGFLLIMGAVSVCARLLPHTNTAYQIGRPCLKAQGQDPSNPFNFDSYVYVLTLHSLSLQAAFFFTFSTFSFM